MASNTSQSAVINKVKPPLAKVVLVGDSGVGKTCFMTRFVTDKYSAHYKATIGADFLSKEVQVSDNTSIILQIWDSAGRERFQSLSRVFYRGSDGFFVFFDLTNRQSFTHVVRHLEELAEFSSEHSQTCIIGTKIDLADKRQVSHQEALELANHLGAKYFEVSSKEDINVKDAVAAMVEGISSKSRNRTVLELPRPIEISLRPARPWFCTVL